MHAWSPKNWGYDVPVSEGRDHIPENFDWSLWLGTAVERVYRESVYYPGNWRKIVDYGCGALGDIGVQIFDTPYNPLALDVPKTIKTECSPQNDYGFPEKKIVT